MFKVTRFKQFILGLGLLATGEEAASLSVDPVDNSQFEKHGVVEFKAQKLSVEHMQDYLKEHHLKIDSGAFLVSSIDSIAPANTPQAGLSSTTLTR